MSHDRDDPPTNWCDWWADLTRLTDDIYYGWPRNTDPALDETNPSFWHWCTGYAPGDGPTVDEDRHTVDEGRWMAASTTAHTLVAREPLHLEPSLLWRCCGTHGYVRCGIWQPC